ncbi:aspartate-alanine antiporter-like transporter [Escherichia coli]
MLGSYSRLCAGLLRLKLGLAGGPLIMALIGRSAVSASCTGLCRQVPTSRCGELGIVLFLSVVGLKSGGDFGEYPGQWRRAKLDWLLVPDYRRSADYCWRSGGC